MSNLFGTHLYAKYKRIKLGYIDRFSSLLQNNHTILIFSIFLYYATISQPIPFPSPSIPIFPWNKHYKLILATFNLDLAQK